VIMRPVSLETRRKMSESRKGMHYHSEEFKKRIAERNRTPENRFKVSVALKGRIFSAETKRKISLSKFGKQLGSLHPRWKGGKATCKECQKLLTEYRPKTGLCRKCHETTMVGSGNPNWLGGITPIHSRIRNSERYQEWRKRVLFRDVYTCQACGKNRGTLHVDHDLPFSLFPNLRFEVLNGQTLCVDCHRAKPTTAHRKALEKIHMMYV